MVSIVLLDTDRISLEPSHGFRRSNSVVIWRRDDFAVTSQEFRYEWLHAQIGSCPQIVEKTMVRICYPGVLTPGIRFLMHKNLLFYFKTNKDLKPKGVLDLSACALSQLPFDAIKKNNCFSVHVPRSFTDEKIYSNR